VLLSPSLEKYLACLFTNCYIGDSWPSSSFRASKIFGRLVPLFFEVNNPLFFSSCKNCLTLPAVYIAVGASAFKFPKKDGELPEPKVGP